MSKKQLIKDNLLLLVGGNIANVFSFLLIILLLRANTEVANTYVAFNSIAIILAVPALVATRVFTIYGPAIFGKIHKYISEHRNQSLIGLIAFLVLLLPLNILISRFTADADYVSSFLIISTAIAMIVSYAFRGLRQYEENYLKAIISLNMETGGRLILSYLLGITLGLGIHGVMIGAVISMIASIFGSYDSKYWNAKLEKLSEVRIIQAFAGSLIVTAGLEFFANFDTAYSLNALNYDHKAQTEYNVLQFFRKIIFYGTFAVSSMVLSIGSKDKHSRKFVFGFTLASGLIIGFGASIVFYLLQPLLLWILGQSLERVSEQYFILFLIFTTLMSTAYLVSNWLLSIKKRAYLFIPIIASSIQFVMFLLAPKTLEGMLDAFIRSSGLFFIFVMTAGLYEVFFIKNKNA